ncbi:MAG: tRNA pseudouridine(55) synthase TruB [Candidatus Nomurabacteria bacterium]|jgi:tRNA pseudouridine55 synthase|nr:tRNA pseudouridine(55) synthase TruB [Candidatus Nomurabacteria bacterium]
MKLDQVLLIDKPAGITSFGVVARVRRVMTEAARAQGWSGKRFRVGHTGTLDPFATGLMIILTGKETKNAGDYSKLDKVYEAEIRLGAVSTTGDPEGEITEMSGFRVKPGMTAATAPPLETVQQTLSSFVGEIRQTPPIYSAIKVDGQRAYKLARQGKVVKMPQRKVTIYGIELISYSYPTLKIRAHVSSGTYIRTLAEDIGQKLGLGAYTTALRRTKVGDFDLKNAQTLSSF